MPERQTHIIERQEWQLRLEREEDMHLVSGVIRRLVEQELSAYLEAYYADYLSSEQVLRIPKVELDLGVIPIRQMERLIQERFRERLGDAVDLQGLLFGQGKAVRDKWDRWLEMLRFFLLHGRYPWWASKRDYPPDRLLSGVIRRRTRATRAMVIDVAGLTEPRKRLIWQFQDDTLYRLFGILHAEPEDFFREYVADLIAVHQHRPIVREEDRRLKKVVQELILLYLVDHQSGSLDQLHFFRHQLERLGVRYGVAYYRILGFLHEALEELRFQGKGSGIVPLVRQLRGQVPGTAATRGRIDQRQVLLALSAYLQAGYPDPVETIFKSRSIASLFVESLRIDPAGLTDLLFDLARKAVVRRRIIHALQDGEIKRLFALLAPSLLETLYAYFALVERVQSRTPAINQEKVAYRRTVQELALKAIIEKARDVYDRKVFIRDQLKLYASRYQVTYPRLLTLLYVDVSVISGRHRGLQAIQETLVALIRELPYRTTGWGRAFSWTGQATQDGYSSSGWGEAPFSGPKGAYGMDQRIDSGNTADASTAANTEGAERTSARMPMPGAGPSEAAASHVASDTSANTGGSGRQREDDSVPPATSDSGSTGQQPARRRSEVPGQLADRNAALPGGSTDGPRGVEASGASSGRGVGFLEPRDLQEIEAYLTEAIQWGSLPEWGRMETVLPAGLRVGGSHHPFRRDQGAVPLLQAWFNKETVARRTAVFWTLWLWSHTERGRAAMARPTGAWLFQGLASFLLRGQGRISLSAGAYRQLLKQLRLHQFHLSVPMTDQLLQRVGVPERPDWQDINLLVQLEGRATAASMLSLLPALEGFLAFQSKTIQQRSKQYLAYSWVWRKTLRKDLPVLLRDSLEQLALLTSKPGAEVRADWVSFLEKEHADLRQQFGASVLPEATSPASAQPSPHLEDRLDLAVFLERIGLLAIGESASQLTEEEAEGRFQEFWQSGALYEALVLHRHDPQIIYQAVENISLEEWSGLVVLHQGERPVVWIEVMDILQQLQEQFAPFRLSRDRFAHQIKEWGVAYLLAQPSAVAIQRDTFLSFLLEKFQLKGLTDRRRIQRLLQDTTKSEALSPVLVDVLEWHIRQDGVVPLRRGIVQKQWQKDLALHYLATGKVPFWGEELGWTHGLVYKVVQAAFQEQDKAFLEPVLVVLSKPDAIARFLPIVPEGQGLGWLERLVPSVGAVSVREWFQTLMEILMLQGRDQPRAKVETEVYRFMLEEQVWLLRSGEGVRQLLMTRFAPRFAVSPKYWLPKGEARPKGTLWAYLPMHDTSEEGAAKATLSFPDALLTYLKTGIWAVPYTTWTTHARMEAIRNLSDAEVRQLLTEWSVLFTRPAVLRRFMEMSGKANLLPLAVRLMQLSGRMDNTTRQWLSLLKERPLPAGQEPVLMGALFRIFFSPGTGTGRQVQHLAEAWFRIAPEYMRILHVHLSKTADADQRRLFRLVDGAMRYASNEGLPVSRDMEIMQYFLQFGSLPAYATSLSRSRLKRMVQSWLTSDHPRFRRQYFQVWKVRTSWEWMLGLFSESEMDLFIRAIDPALPLKLAQLASIISRAGQTGLWSALGLGSPQSRVIFLAEWWSKGREAFEDPDLLLRKVVYAYARSLQIQPTILVRQWIDRDPPLPQKDLIWLRSMQQGIQIESRLNEAQKDATPVVDALEEGEAVHVYNAGLCLLWPFLGRFFRRLDMIVDDDFADDTIRARGVMLSQYLVTGSTEMGEQELALNKVLCGMPLHKTLEESLEVTDAEKALAESLLGGVIQNWEKMQGTRPSTFQETFLQREGRLFLREKNWELIVEKKAYDVLLTTLPWQMQMIRLAWMDKPLQVVWN